MKARCLKKELCYYFFVDLRLSVHATLLQRGNNWKKKSFPRIELHNKNDKTNVFPLLGGKGAIERCISRYSSPSPSRETYYVNFTNRDRKNDIIDDVTFQYRRSDVRPSHSRERKKNASFATD